MLFRSKTFSAIVRNNTDRAESHLRLAMVIVVTLYFTSNLTYVREIRYALRLCVVISGDFARKYTR